MNKTVRKLGLVATALAMAIGVASFAPQASAASHGYCVGYANSAVSQQSRNLAGHCGYFGFRWHRAWNLHYDWCRGVDRWRARQERQLRRSMLRACGA